MFPQEITDVVDFLREYEHSLVVSGGADARQDSANSENKIIMLLFSEFASSIKARNVGKTHNRDWCDFAINSNSGKTIYVDLKISRLSGDADNTNAKKPIYYVLTGDKPDNVPDKESEFFKLLKENMQPNEEDFYYVVIGKKAKPGEPTRAFAASLKTLRKINPNRSNPPFQCVWKDNTIPMERDYEQAKKFLLDTWSLSIKAGLRALNEGMPQHFPEFFEEE